MNSSTISPQIAKRADFLLSLSPETKINSSMPVNRPPAISKSVQQKHMLIGIGTASAIAAIAIGCLLVQRKKRNELAQEVSKRATELITNAESALSDARANLAEAQGVKSDCLKKAHSIADEVSKIFKEGKKNNYADIVENGLSRTFKKGGGNAVEMIEHTANGTVTRKAIKSEKCLSIDDFINNVTVKMKNNKFITSFADGLDASTDNSRKYMREIFYNKDGSIASFAKRIYYPEGGKEKKIGIYLKFENGELVEALKNSKLNYGELTEANWRITYGNNASISYLEKVKFSKNICKKAEKNIELKNGVFTQYRENVKFLDDGSKLADYRVSFTPEREVTSFIEDIRIGADNIPDWKIELYPKGKGWVRRTNSAESLDLNGCFDFLK